MGRTRGVACLGHLLEGLAISTAQEQRSVQNYVDLIGAQRHNLGDLAQSRVQGA